MRHKIFPKNSSWQFIIVARWKITWCVPLICGLSSWKTQQRTHGPQWSLARCHLTEIMPLRSINDNGLEDIQPSPWYRALRCAVVTLNANGPLDFMHILMNVVSKVIPRQLQKLKFYSRLSCFIGFRNRGFSLCTSLYACGLIWLENYLMVIER